MNIAFRRQLRTWRRTYSKYIGGPTMAMYRVTDRLHQRRTVRVRCQDIARIVSAWLAELGAHSPLTEELACAVCAGNWPAVYAICDRLSVDVTAVA